MTQRTQSKPQSPPDKNQVWAIYLEKNPHWVTDGVHLSPDGLRKFVEQVWQHGYNHAVANTRVTIE